MKKLWKIVVEIFWITLPTLMMFLSVIVSIYLND